MTSIPQFNFILNGEQSDKFVGADEVKFRNALAKLQGALSGKASEHMNMQFKQFKPMNRLPTSFTATGQIEKMKQFVKKFASESTGEVRSTANVVQWIDGSFDMATVSREAVDELRELAEVAEDKSKIALIDVFRLLVLQESQAEYVLTAHWELIEVCVFGYLSAQNLQDSEAKVIHNYHQMCLKTLANVFATQKGRALMQDLERGRQLVAFCNTSLRSVNVKVQLHTALVLFNFVLCFEKDSKKPLQPLLEATMKGIDEILSNQAVTDKDLQTALILCECRLLYMNHDLVTWVEEQFKLFFKETHSELAARSAHAEVKQAVEDVFSMVNLEDK